MIFVTSAQLIAANGLYLLRLVADTASDLPAGNTIQVENAVYDIAPGSSATAADTGGEYLRSPSGSWVLQPSRETQIILPDVYDKTETDGLLSDLDASLTAQMYVHDSTQVNLNDVTWTKSGGGLYYSSTVTIPDSPIRLLYHATLSGFSNLRATDIVTPACRRSGGWTGFLLYANTNSFLSGAWVTVSVSGLP